MQVTSYITLRRCTPGQSRCWLSTTPTSSQFANLDLPIQTQPRSAIVTYTPNDASIAGMHFRPLSVRSANAIDLITGRSIAAHHLPPDLFRSRPRLTTSYGLLKAGVCSRRYIHIPNVLLPPVVFTGLVLALYAWKSFVMITLQNKIIYNPYMPPSARHDKIEDYQSRLFGIEWKEVHMKSVDKTDLALAVASVSSGPGSEVMISDVAYHVYILYLQGLFCCHLTLRLRSQ